MWAFRVLFRLTLLLCLLAPIGAIVAWLLVFDAQPAVERLTEFTPDHIERAQRILRANDPRRMRTGSTRLVALSADDVDMASNYLFHRYADGGAETHFAPGRATILASVRASGLPGRPYVNLEIGIVEGTPMPTIDRFRVGLIPLPAALAQFGVRRLLRTTFSDDDLLVLGRATKAVTLDETGARLTYEWHTDLAEAVRSALVRPEDRERLRAYHQALADAVSVLPNRALSLAELLTPLFAVAAARSADDDPVVENRAAILVLTFYVDGRPLSDIVPEARGWPRARRRLVRLNQRDDLTKHFMVSAALSANTGGPFADAVGIYKEVADSRGDSGFSFVDLAADRAGSRLGTIAESPGAARQLQARLAAALTERVLMPATRDLPELMLEPEFQRRFGGIDAPAYARLVADIDQRIALLPLYR